VRLLIDTKLLLWAALDDQRFPRAAATLLGDPANQLYVSSASIWEVAIKTSRGNPSFRVEPLIFRRNLLANGYIELPITSEHAIATQSLPPLHKDPFDRILIAQATVEGITLLTSDRQVAKYPGPIRKV
jgi:PIN domain nuclease of toxin-antitoxin system